MNKKPKKPFIPPEKHDTVRREIVEILRRQEMSARQISSTIGISEKDVFDHLEHIRAMLHGKGTGISVTPARCMKCGFVFRKRDRLSKPGRCPVCRGEQVEDPLFSID
ncbi:MAG TPA: ArsR family transcriptional regulator [Geobacteraceae bacterium]|nr:ArsR family transcriptional regulator [Geobacteraceae bacterium]